MDAETIDDDMGGKEKVLYNKKQINEIILAHFQVGIRDSLEALDEDSELWQTIADELGVDPSENDLGDIAEVKITF